MNVLFCTQSESLKLFDTLRGALEALLPIEKSGFVVADSMAYKRWLDVRSGFEQEGHYLLKEWEVTARPHGEPDLVQLSRYERELGGEPGLFGAIVADRRLFMGPDCAYTQDYRRRFSDEELLFILQRGLERIEVLFDNLKPDLVVSFICVTMLDYLAYLFAKNRGIRFLNLRPTRVGDRVSFSRHLNDPSPELAAQYQHLLEGAHSDYEEEARNLIRYVREQHGRYEGVVRTSDKPALQVNTARFTRLDCVVTALHGYLAYRQSTAYTDNHVPDPLRRLYFTAWRNPRQAASARKFFQDRYVLESDLAGMRYTFFPLHTEPEVSLLVYGRPYVNQIEIIRMLAISLPVDMILVVKEHPWMVGKRSHSSYEKMLNIPRVRFADPKLEARTLIKHAALVSVVTGSVALEAAILGKPVITFGDCPYNLLPPTMVRRCNDPRHLQSIVREAISFYANDEHALTAYIQAVYETSTGANLYSVLLGKKQVHAERSGTYEEEVRKVASELQRHIAMPSLPDSPGSALW